MSPALEGIKRREGGPIDLKPRLAWPSRFELAASVRRQ
ncbi:MAG: hypothetical protein ACJASY_001911 [Halioglobus sp.]|jgi:hypothetical protein